MPIVAIGASAGGLEAASALFDKVPPKTGMAFILVQHLDPTHKSLLVDLLAEHTAMAVVEATDSSALLPDQIHVIPPGRYLSVHTGTIKLTPRQSDHGARLPFDFLLSSLAEEDGRRTIAVILSGTGADGSNGIAALKVRNGHVIAQDPQEAEYGGMPRSAIDTGLVDQVCRVHDIPPALAVRAELIANRASPDTSKEPAASTSLTEIIAYLKDETAHDFRHYKPGTLERRLDRRMALLSMKRGDFAAYLELLRGQPKERNLLAKDLLINVTSFFRDGPVFQALTATIIPDIVKQLPDGQPLRIWVAGCSTGEEAYSIAIICHEAIERSGRDVRLQVFASDVDPDAIAIAREGLYPAEIAADVAADRLRLFFTKDETAFRVSPILRADVVFTVQDVMTDPPFSRIDLVSCRNLLIYLNPEAQAKVIALFHFALHENGILVLGSAETVGNAADRFEVVSKSERIYRHISRSRIGDAGFPLSFAAAPPVLHDAEEGPAASRNSTLADLCLSAVLARHAPAAILINSKRQCLYSMGPTERYLRMGQGYATLDLLALAPPALRTKLLLGIEQIDTATPYVAIGRTRLTHDGAGIWCSITIEALDEGQGDLLLVCFVEEPGEIVSAATIPNGGDTARVAELEHELESTQAELQAAIHFQETSNQEQKAINEEALSVNEEFQSTNEELLTSKEELQSLNEELTALNNQLQETLERQRLTSDDLKNVLFSTDVGTLFLDMDLKIRFYTPAIKSLLNIIPGDMGRPLADLKPIADDLALATDAQLVLSDEAAIEREVCAPDGAWFMRRIFPYRAHDNRIEGVVITFSDITDRKLAAEALEAAQLASERANLAKSRFLAAASHDLRQPLQSLALLQELLVQCVAGEKPQKLLARQQQTLGAMSSMLNALLDINQIEAGVVEAKPVAFSLNAMLDGLRNEFTYLAQTRSLALHIVPTSAIVESDPAMLEQILRNLLGNAIKYTKSGKILLGCRRRGQALRIEVWDSGIGIAHEQLHAIFDEFHQIDNAARERSLGLGLGLSIVKQLAHLLDHEIDVRSTPGKGSMFAITLARAGADEAKAIEPGSATGPGQEQSPQHHKIVVIDDDPNVLELLQEVLTGDGHIVKTAPGADAALKLISGGAIKPEIILTDFNLPGDLNGLDLLTRLRAHLGYDLPGIILTGDIATATLTSIGEADCAQLSKPVQMDELRAAIERAVPANTNADIQHAPLVTDSGAPITYLIDDDQDIRKTLRDVLEEDGRTVEDFRSAEAFLESYQQGSAGCLLIDAYLPGMGGVALLQALRDRGDHLPAILITGSSDVGLAVEAMRTGACDFIEKPVSRAALLASITRAIDQSHDIQLVDAAHDHAAANVAHLTSRQRQVMDLVLAGHPSKNIAADLGISQRTVENHRAAVMRKMEAKSLPQLARNALAAGQDDQADQAVETQLDPE
jgi:two-component system, chemotaxis family, CheB/CheR fusion protein